MVKETRWKSGFAPKALVISWALTMGDDMAAMLCGLRDFDAVFESISSKGLAAEPIAR